MAINNPLDGRQPYTRARKIIGRVQPLENPEEFACISHIESSAIVAHKKRGLCLVRRADFDASLGPFAGEFPGIAEQIVQRNSQQMFVALGSEVRSDNKLDGACRINAAEFRGDRLGERAQINGPAL